MRIWSLHPKYLDAKGLVALWREALLAKHVLLNNTKGYKNHPQLNRFKKLKNPVEAIEFYLYCVLEESKQRGYHFDSMKISSSFRRIRLKVNRGQLEFESTHLLRKLKKRAPVLYKRINSLKKFEAHPMFRIVEGEIESWEII